ncbi:MAG: hypothetical protein AMJ91_01100 [candidate division Zixibacteria bacterium SM23_73_3]|nr:MAG: hypothetical protein AMJ91_01100 [candidate division Zixibacteria bacterium SM23_73_3]
MREKGSFIVFLAVVLLLMSPRLTLADDPEIQDTCRVECLDVTLPEQQVVIGVSVYNDEDLGGVVIPLIFGYPWLDVVCDSVSFVGTRIEDAEYLGVSIDTANYKLLFYAAFIDSDLTSGDGVVANLYFTIGSNWDSTLCIRVDTTFYPPTTILEFTPRATGQALHPEFKMGCLGSGYVAVPDLIDPSNQEDVCSPDTFDFVWSKSGEDVFYTLQYAHDSNFTTGVVIIEDLEDTSYTVWLPRQTYFWHVKTTNLCDKDSPYQDRAFSFQVFQSGDPSNDGVVDLTDVLYIVSYLYKDGPDPDPPASGDAFCDGEIDLTDLLLLISYLFKGGPAPCCP